MEREQKITNPAVKEVMEGLGKIILQEHAKHLAGFYATAGEQFATQVARDLTPPPPKQPGFFQHLFGGGDREQ